MARTARQLRHLARVLRGERAVTAATRRALGVLLTDAVRALESAGYDTAVLDSRFPGWRSALDGDVVPAIYGVFTAAWDATARGIIDPQPYATRHLEGVWNRLVGVSDSVFDSMRLTLEEGRQAGEGIPELAARVDALLSDEERWTNRARTIARTEVIGANNAGAYGSARATADVLGVRPGEVIKEWLSTMDDRTRETHVEADGLAVAGMDTMFEVGYGLLEYPGDPSGPPEEVINCRCTVLFHYPGDPDYEGLALTAAAPFQEEDETMPDDATSVVVVAVPAAGDPVQGIGEEEKHATLYYLGSLDPEDPEHNPALIADGARDDLVARVAAEASRAAFTAAVTGVETLGDEGARVWLLDPADGIGEVRAAVAEGLADLALPGVTDRYPDFTPHVTIGYPADPAAGSLDPPIEEAAAAVETIAFDRLSVWWGNERLDAPLGAPTAEESGMSVDLATAIAAVREAGFGLTPAPALAVGDPPTGPAPVEEEEAPVEEEAAADGEPFYGILWPEGVLSGDGRAIETGATVWRDLPLPLMAQDATAPGHDGAIRVGRLDSITRDETSYSVPVIRYTGVWDTDPDSIETARQVDRRMVRGISVDGDAVTVELRGSDGGALDPMVDDFPDDGIIVEVATAARIAGGTVCSIPAFHQGYIANGRPENRTDPEPGWNADGTPKDEPLPAGAVVASAWSLVAAGPSSTPAAAFTRPAALDDLPSGTPLTVLEDGRVYGHLATWGTCHIGIDGLCQEPPASPSNYAYFATGSVLCDDGSTVPVGPLVMGTGHAGLRLGYRPAAAHYDDTGTAVADVVMGQDHIGIWFSGLIRPGTTEAQVYALRASGKVSGDWRNVGGALELVAALVVNTPGFPIPRAALAASSAHGAEAMVAAGIVQGNDTAEAPHDLARLAAQVVAFIERRNRAQAAAARLDSHRRLARGRRAAIVAARLAERAVTP